MKIEETLKRKFERLLIDTAGNDQTNHQSRASLERLLRISELESTEVWYSVVTRLRKHGAYISRRIFRGHEITSRMNASLELLWFDKFPPMPISGFARETNDFSASNRLYKRRLPFRFENTSRFPRFWYFSKFSWSNVPFSSFNFVHLTKSNFFQNIAQRIREALLQEKNAS